MRIIGGKFKNKKILLPTDDKTRPLKDMVRAVSYTHLTLPTIVDV